MSLPRDLILWGATGQAKVLHELIEGTEFRLAALVDNRDVPSPFDDIPLLAGLAGLDRWLADRPGGGSGIVGAVAVGGGRGADRLELMQLFSSRGIALVTLVHRTAFVAGDSAMAEGCQILAQASICTHARLARGVIVNTMASVDHDCVLGDGVHVGPGAHMAGEVRVGARSFIGTGAIILPRISIGEDCIVGAGSVVLRDLSDGSVVVGNPARSISR